MTTPQKLDRILDCIGIGLGPFNLSIAALSDEEKTHLKTLFLERKSHFSWHPGLLLSDAKMQTSFLKDLVTAVDPTSPYSFLNYLVTQRKFYPFCASGQSVISRLEFSDYLGWTAHQLPNTQFGCDVKSVAFEQDHFRITTDKEVFNSQHLVIGTGMQPHVPECIQPFVSETCFHASELALRSPDLTGKRVAIIGGGQTGADIFQHTFDKQFGKPTHIEWISRRANIEQLDEGCFTDQYFMPDYVNQFYQLDSSNKQQEVSHQKLASDGVTSDCLQGIYQRLYHDKYVLRNPRWWKIKTHQSLISSRRVNGQYQLDIQHGLTKQVETINADIVILCTGFNHDLPQCLDELRPYIMTDEQDRILLSSDYCLQWKGMKNNSIYIVNSGTDNHGIAEPQLSLAAWRAAKIINHLAQDSVYELAEDDNIIDWGDLTFKPEKHLAAVSSL
ncbi:MULTISPECIES: lysine N(6)-hydroxylase/L-ornithine N(5)-oxygenase family protein [Vibrio]|uniref:Aerobactin biosynthesis protein IucD n=3 Tax=Vibrio casei TaxID=673372 RepID=A0A368LGZ9_9VIBR|nr:MULTISPECIES: SidA/IucD/PvdA family monooxygenase [Vibrio]RCS69941.1 aerobactin biosynthesis protein IucD [Vibrio casei]SJN28895.1 L-lysine 6-monooxygenase [NADPH], aerobactin biosynthesis protein IucD @ Siderophore biosynthesis protein, monooxygenase [Vibrio casei]HBV75919.1 aerobactin biosynthesis protein IucD [Vibrio sp.]